MKAINVLLAILVSAMIALGVFEGGLRLLGMGPPKILNEFDSTMGWSKQADISVTRTTGEYDVTFELNELGLREDAGQTSAKPEGTFRVVCLGDSFTLGYTVQREDLFVDQLEHWWNAEGRNVDVVNTGTEGYATDQEVAWLLKHGEEWKPDLVLLFAYDNDLYYNGQSNYLRFPKPRFNAEGKLDVETLEDPGSRSFFERTAIGNMLRTKDKLDTFEPVGSNNPAVLKEFGPLFVTQPEFMLDALARTTGALKALKAKCEALGARAVIVPIPSHSSIDEDFSGPFGEAVLGMGRSAWAPDQPVEHFLASAKAAGLASIDPRAELRAVEGDLYYQRDFHLNAAGNAALAKIVHAELQSMGLMPASTSDVAFADVAHASAPAEGGMPGFLPYYLGLWLLIGSLYVGYYRDEKAPLAFLKVGGLLALIFSIAIGGSTGIGMLPPQFSQIAMVLMVFVIIGFVLFKLGDKLGTITELILAFVGRGHWYLMPLVVILLSVGSLLVVAAASPLVAPFIYTLF